MNSSATAGKPRGLYYHGWNIVAVCILASAAGNGVPTVCFSLFLHDWSQQFHVPVSQLVLAVALNIVTASMTAPLVGAWSDKYPARWLFGLGLVGVAVFCLAMSWVTAPWQILVLYAVVFPLPLTLSSTVPVNTLLSRWFTKRLGLAIGLASFGLGAAGIILPPIVAHLLPLVGWRLIWRGAGLITALVILPAVMLVVRDKPHPERDGLHHLTGASAGAAGHGHGAPAGPSSITFGDVFRRRNFWLLLFTVMPLVAVHIVVGQNIAPYATAHGYSGQTAGTLISLMFAFSLAATLLLGGLADRFGNRGPLAGVIVIAVAGCLAMAFAPNLAVIVVGCALLGAVGGVFPLLGSAIGAEFGADGFGKAFGAALFFLPLPAFTAAGFAKVEEMVGSYTPGFLGMAVTLLIPCLLVFMMRPHVRKAVADQAPLVEA